MSLVDRNELIGLLFNVADISATLRRIEALIKEDDDGEEEVDGG